MSRDDNDSTELLRRAAAGDREAVNALFARHRDRLRGVVRLRLNRRLQGRIDSSGCPNSRTLDEPLGELHCIHIDPVCGPAYHHAKEASKAVHKLTA